MFVVGAMAAGYGLLAVAFRTPLAALLTDVSDAVSVNALLAWTLFAVGFGVLWLRERPSRLRLLGAAATALGVALIAAFP